MCSISDTVTPFSHSILLHSSTFQYSPVQSSQVQCSPVLSSQVQCSWTQTFIYRDGRASTIMALISVKLWYFTCVYDRATSYTWEKAFLIIPYDTVLLYTPLYHTASHYIILYHPVLHHTTLFCIILCYTTLRYSVSSCATPHYTILYHPVLHHTSLHHRLYY